MVHEGHGLSKFVAKLERRQVFTIEERVAFLGLSNCRSNYEAAKSIIAEEDIRTDCLIIESGFVGQRRTRLDGTHLIDAFHVPGDMVDLQSIQLGLADYNIVTYMPTVTVSLKHADLLELAARYPAVANALWLDTIVDAGVYRRWSANVEDRLARARTAYLLLELAARFDVIAACGNSSYHLPVMHRQLAGC